MKYAVLLYQHEGIWAGATEQVQQEYVAAHTAFDRAVRDRPTMLAGDALTSVSTRPRCGTVSSVGGQRRVGTKQHEPEPLVRNQPTRVDEHPVGVLLHLGVDGQERPFADRDRLGP